MIEVIKKISELIKTQDNRITDQPLFVVEREVLDYGYNSGYADEYDWYNDEICEPADEDETERLDELEANCEDTGRWQQVYYKSRWEFVTACFTEQGCKDVIAANGHNIGKSRIYAHGSYRNSEYQAVRKFLLTQ